MSGTYVQYPSFAGGGSLSSISFSIGLLDGLPPNPFGASVSSNSIFLQSFTAVFPGLVNSASQTFGGVKTFASNPIFSSLTQGSVLFAGPGGLISQDNTDFFWNNTNKQLILSQPSALAHLLMPVLTVNVDPDNTFGAGNALALAGSVGGQSIIVREDGGLNLSSLVLCGGDAFGTGANVQFFGSNADPNGGSVFFMLGGGATDSEYIFADNNGSPLLEITSDGTTFLHAYNSSGPLFVNSVGQLISGSVSLTSQVSGILPSANLPPLSGITGSVSLTTQVSGILPPANLPPLSSITGSVSLTSQVSGNLPLSQTQGSISLTNQVSGNLPLSQTQGSVSFSQLQPYPQLTIGSVTQTSSTGGATYTASWPGVQGANGTFLQNDGTGKLSWNAPAGATIGSITATSSAGGNTFTLKFPGTIGSGASYLRNDGNGNLGFTQIKTPTIQRFTNGSGTYTTPANVLYLEVTVVGGGGGGGGTGSGATSGVSGTASSFAGVIAFPGSGGGTATFGGAGGLVSSTTFVTINSFPGGRGSAGANLNNTAGGLGGANPFGGGGANGQGGANSGDTGATNTGAGGGGAGAGVTSGSGSGGGAGGWIQFYITQPAATYAYSVGGGSIGGTGGTGGGGGGGGANGLVVVKEYY